MDPHTDGRDAAAPSAARFGYRINLLMLSASLAAGLSLPTAVRFAIPLVSPGARLSFERLAASTIVAVHVAALVLGGAALLFLALQERSRRGTLLVDEGGVRVVDARGQTRWQSAWAWLSVAYSASRSELVLRRGSQIALTIPGGRLSGDFVVAEDLPALRAAVSRYANIEVLGDREAREAGRLGFVYGAIVTGCGLGHLLLTPMLAKALGRERFTLYWFLAILGPILLVWGGIQWMTGRGGIKVKAETGGGPARVAALVIVTGVLVVLSLW